MTLESDKPRLVLDCPRCGSRRFEVHGLVVGGATVKCSGCGAKAGGLDALLMSVEERTGMRQGQRAARLYH